jgi:hypothetical protein
MMWSSIEVFEKTILASSIGACIVAGVVTASFLKLARSGSVTPILPSRR